MKRRIEAYVESLGPWADRVASQMLLDLDKANKRAFLGALKPRMAVGDSRRIDDTVNVGMMVAGHGGKHSQKISAALKKEHAGPLGLRMREIHDEQVRLIKSIPQEAAARAQKLARDAMMDGSRADEIAQMLRDTEGVTLNRATLIARTEISKSNTALTRSRSEYVGVSHYEWTTTGDESVRDSHQEMAGEIIAWDNPPTLSDGMTGHAGDFPNCRCIPVPVLPQDQ